MADLQFVANRFVNHVTAEILQS